jgi:glucan-binding YG repeat protein
LWQEIDGVTYYFGQSGRARGGWLTFMDRQYYLTENGAVTTGWTTIDQTEYLFGEDGVLQMTMKGSAEDGYYVVYDRTAAEHAVSEDAKLLLG